MRKRWIILSGVIIAAGTLISQFPLAWVGPKMNIGGKSPIYSGTIWQGNMSGTDAGTLEITTSLLRLFKGQNPLHITGGPLGLNITAEAGPSGLRAFNLEGSLKSLALQDPRLGRVGGSFRVDIPDMKMKDRCDYADGTVWTDFLAQNYNQLRWRGPVLEGPVTCEDGNAVLNMTGKDDAADISAQITVNPNGQYHTDIFARVTSPEAGLALQYFGFSRQDDGYQLTEQGRWQ